VTTVSDEKKHIHSEALDHRADGRSVVGGLLPGAVYGPVNSRRYGRALGINLVPPKSKVCSFDCIYCECGFTEPDSMKVPKESFPPAGPLVAELRRVLELFRNQKNEPDSIVLSGNGESTMHPDFAGITKGFVKSRNNLAPDARLVLLSNGTMLEDANVRRALLRYDDRVMKLDAGTEETFQRMCRPLDSITLDRLVELLKQVRPFTLQAMFIRAPVDNTTDEEIAAWIERVREAGPESVQVYSLDRVPADLRCEPVPREELEPIAERLRSVTDIPVTVF
jgi:wyosine [tRNA(Phe)-imidazoG37] synthetase (radical SAM superfamily)